MTFVNETYSAPTYTKVNAGYGILCNNETILCNSEKYDCVGAIILKTEAYVTETYTKELY